jgi:hypothetical protein
VKKIIICIGIAAAAFGAIRFIRSGRHDAITEAITGEFAAA